VLRERWKQLKLFDRNLIIYFFILTLIIILFRNNLENWFGNVLLHTSIIGVIFLFIPWLDKQNGRVVRFFRYWYIVIAFPLLYLDVGQFLHLITQREFDPLIIEVDRWLCGELPNIWVQNYVTPQLTEFMQLSYSIYWITIPLGGFIFYFDGDKQLYEYLLHFVTFTFFLSYIIFIIFPVAGPRFYMANQIRVPYQGLFLGNYLRSFVHEVGFRGGAFPSSHVGVAVVILLFVWHFKRKVAIFLFLPLVLALSVATVYGQYHYLTDVLAGLLMGLTIGGWGIFRLKTILN